MNLIIINHLISGVMVRNMLGTKERISKGIGLGLFVPEPTKDVPGKRSKPQLKYTKF